MKAPDSVGPVVSVVIPTFDGRRWICDAIDSALAQTYTPVEVIVVDDGSSDDTHALLERRYGSRIRYRYQPNRGLPTARNVGLGLARGRYVQFLDADDLLHPDKLALQVDALERTPEYAVAFSDFASFDSDPAQHTPHRVAERFRRDDVWRSLLAGNFIVVHAALSRRDVLVAAGGFDEELSACEDYDLWLRLAARGCGFVHTPGVFALYRQTPTSMSRNRRRQIRSTVDVLRKARRQRPFSTVGEWKTYARFRLGLASVAAKAHGVALLGRLRARWSQLVAKPPADADRDRGGEDGEAA